MMPAGLCITKIRKRNCFWLRRRRRAVLVAAPITHPFSNQGGVFSSMGSNPSIIMTNNFSHTESQNVGADKTLAGSYVPPFFPCCFKTLWIGGFGTSSWPYTGSLFAYYLLFEDIYHHGNNSDFCFFCTLHSSITWV